MDANLSSSHTLSRQTQVFFRRCKSSMRKSAGSSLDVVVRGSPVAGLGTLDPNSEDDEKDGSRDDDASGSGSDVSKMSTHQTCTRVIRCRSYKLISHRDGIRR